MNDKSVVKDFPLVCEGGSAGSLDVYTRLLKNLPFDMEISIVIVNHMNSDGNQLRDILSHYTQMPCEVITERLSIQQNRVYVIPGNRDLLVLNGEFRLMPESKIWGWSDVITLFLRSLTHNWRGKIIAVIVSGLAYDGAVALCDIKGAGGITIAQNPDTAERPDMPLNAIASGFIDFVLSPEDIAKEIVRIA
jgi:two-component system chemotaxis response regulator CheB